MILNKDIFQIRMLVFHVRMLININSNVEKAHAIGVLED